MKSHSLNQIDCHTQDSCGNKLSTFAEESRRQS